MFTKLFVFLIACVILEANEPKSNGTKSTPVELNANSTAAESVSVCGSTSNFRFVYLYLTKCIFLATCYQSSWEIDISISGKELRNKT